MRDAVRLRLIQQGVQGVQIVRGQDAGGMGPQPGQTDLRIGVQSWLRLGAVKTDPEGAVLCA
ncbi:hypothetical protein [Streptomyces chrestomyceticus]|uniref:hypothetical protein n=1 Tax=Streptomyces chrestomyceticus TaxID=68185 RepID=UPI0012B95613|nr:hypothetical protein [Streptomyces chrestomyceticus]